MTAHLLSSCLNSGYSSAGLGILHGQIAAASSLSSGSGALLEGFFAWRLVSEKWMSTRWAHTSCQDTPSFHNLEHLFSIMGKIACGFGAFDPACRPSPIS